MAFFGNIIWWVTSFIVPLVYLIGGVILFPLLPFLWPVIKYCMAPFGREIVSVSYLKSFKNTKTKTEDNAFEKASPLIKFLGNFVWIFTFGWILALAHILSGIINVFFIWTIISIPNIMAHFRMVPVAFAPFGRKIISKELAKKLRNEKANQEFKKLKG
jgi:uncharacterized membrane protein YccF (DUF307 family)